MKPENTLAKIPGWVPDVRLKNCLYLKLYVYILDLILLINLLIVPNLCHVSLSTSYMEFMGFPGSSTGKESTCNAGDLHWIPDLGRCPGGGHGNPLQYSCLENPHRQRSLAGYSPQGCKESDMTEAT